MRGRGSREGTRGKELSRKEREDRRRARVRCLISRIKDREFVFRAGGSWGGRRCSSDGNLLVVGEGLMTNRK